MAKLGYPFRVIPSNAPETRKPNESPRQLVIRLSNLKARNVARRIDPASGPYLVIGADTVVVLGGKIFGKPGSLKGAARMLLTLSGKTHRVYTGVSVLNTRTSKVRSGFEVSKVKIRKLSREEAMKIGRKHRDKSGSYACQDRVDHLVEKIEGDWQTVVGLPTRLLRRLTP